MRHIGHHVHLRLDRRELISECDFYEQRPWRYRQHQWHSVLLSLSGGILHEKDGLWVDLLQFADLDVAHSFVILVALHLRPATLLHGCVVKVHL